MKLAPSNGEIPPGAHLCDDCGLRSKCRKGFDCLGFRMFAESPLSNAELARQRSLPYRGHKLKPSAQVTQ